MFCVYGKSRPLAKKTVYKLMGEYFSIISKVLRKLDSLSQRDKEIIIAAFIDIEFKVMKPKKYSHEFSAPEFSKECYNLMKLDEFNFNGLLLMKKKPKTEGVTHSKKTGKPLFLWVIQYA